MESFSLYNPAGLLRDEVSNITNRYFYVDQFTNAGEFILFDANGMAELKTSAVHLATLRGSWGLQTDTVLNRMPLGMSFIIDQMKVVHYRGTALIDSDFTIRMYRADAMGKLETYVIPLEEGLNPKNPHAYILEYVGLDWLVDPFFGISFETTLEGNYGVSFGISMIENQKEMLTF